jgi:hypothetical protein
MHFKHFRTLALAAISLLPATLLADTPASTQWVVTSAKLSGGGNDYVTSLRIVNPNPFEVEVDLYFFQQTPLDASNNAADATLTPKVVVNVPANATLALDDVIASKFGLAPPVAGGIRVESFAATGGLNPDPAGVWVLSQTLVVNARNQAGTLGTNGFAIPSQSQDQVVAVGETAYVPYISASPSTSSGYRTNLFLLSANATDPTHVTVTLRKGDGTSVGSKNLTLGKLAQTQINRIGEFFGYVPAASDTNLTALVTVTSGGPVATGASIIDNAIGSISYAPPVKMPVANNGAYGLILDDGGYSFSGRADVFNGAFDLITAGIVIPSCAGQDTLFFVQGFGTAPGQNTTFTKNADGSTSFAGTQVDGSGATAATFSGKIQTYFDGTIYGTLTYTRGSAPGGTPCPAATVTYPFSGAKGLDL